MSRDSRPLRDSRDAHDPHTVSLKVLRLSHPSFARQNPLPRETTIIPRHLSLALPDPKSKYSDDFALSPLLILPQAFGSVYVGETFTCSLSANNELAPTDTLSQNATDIRIVAEIQTPSQSLPLKLRPQSDEPQPVGPGSSLQKVLHFPLKEEGSHVLAVNVSYSEPSISSSSEVTQRTRSFRKLYQFIAQPCLGVRTKSTELVTREEKSHYVLEAQLENLSEGTLVLSSATLQPRPPFLSTPLNWDLRSEDHPPILNPHDVHQVAFLLRRDPGKTPEEELTTPHDDDDAPASAADRTVLGQLTVTWHGAMGQPGTLSTGDLMTRPRP